mgnify:CR=1 FL=1|jgi:hypothetical protein
MEKDKKEFIRELRVAIEVLDSEDAIIQRNLDFLIDVYAKENKVLSIEEAGKFQIEFARLRSQQHKDIVKNEEILYSLELIPRTYLYIDRRDMFSINIDKDRKILSERVGVLTGLYIMRNAIDDGLYILKIDRRRKLEDQLRRLENGQKPLFEPATKYEPPIVLKRDEERLPDFCDEDFEYADYGNEFECGEPFADANGEFDNDIFDEGETEENE